VARLRAEAPVVRAAERGKLRFPNTRGSMFDNR
jgi:hypothetical protein